VRTRAEVALYVLNHKRAHLRELEQRFRVTIMVNADATIGGQQSFVIDRGEQVHSLEAARALAVQPTTVVPQEEEETEEEAEEWEDETEGESESAAEAARPDDQPSDQPSEPGEGRGRRRRRRRRRRGDGMERPSEEAAGADAASEYREDAEAEADEET